MTDDPAMPRSLWAASAREAAPARPPLDGTVRADVAVIGGGFTGLSTALHLAERGIDVALLEAAAIGWGASGRNGGQVIPGLKRDPDELERSLGPEQGARLAASTGAAADLVFDLIARHKIDCEPVRAGWIQGAHAAPAFEAIKRRAEQWQRRGAPVEVLSAEAIAARLGAPVYCGGLIDKRAGTVQPLSYARGLARAAQAAGARLFEQSAARALNREGARWRVATDHGALDAEHVVLATDAYTDALWPGLAQSLLTVQSIQMATRPLGDNRGASILAGGECLSETRKIAFYFRRDAAGRFLIGGRGPTRDSDGAAMFAALEASLPRLFPALERADLEFRWSGRIAMTLDQLPHLHEPAPGLHVGLGYNGRGIAMATLMGRILADRVGGRDTEFPVTQLTPIRWHALRQPLMSAAIAYYRLKDRIGLAS